MKKFRQWLKDFLGISEVITKLHNIEGDVDSLVIKQLDEIDPLPVDPPECDENSPYEYLDGGKGLVAHDYYVIWLDGFAGPFKEIEQAQEYAHYLTKHHGRFGRIERLCPILFRRK